MKIHLIGDLHVGHSSFNEKVLNEKLKEIEEEKAISRIILMGDLIEFATKKSVGTSVYETTMSNQEQIKYIKNKLEPFKDIIDGSLKGNHEYRADKDVSIDIADNLCDMLGIPYLKYSGIVTYAWNHVAYNINVWHGKGSTGTTGNALNNCIKMSEKAFADVYAMGHCHKLAKTSRIFKVPDSRNKQITQITQHFVLTGSALDYDDNYPDMQNLEIADLGFPTIELRGIKHKKNIKVTL